MTIFVLPNYLTNLALVKAARSPQWKLVPGGIHTPFFALLAALMSRSAMNMIQNASFNIMTYYLLMILCSDIQCPIYILIFSTLEGFYYLNIFIFEQYIFIT